MKNQYVGDQKDSFKYRILQELSDEGEVKIKVGWMLTKDDNSRNGGKIEYLKSSKRWPPFVSALCRELYDIVSVKKNRNVEEIEQRGIIPGATYFSEFLPTNKKDREAYFHRFIATTEPHDLIFLDPDTGIERQSSPRKGSPRSSEYLYWNELELCYQENRSVMVFQYFRTPPTLETLMERAVEIIGHLNPPKVMVFNTPAQVAFFLVPAEDSVELFVALGTTIEEASGGVIQFMQF